MLVVQLCLTLFDPMDCSPPVSPVHEIPQARILEWVAIPFSRGSSPPRDQIQISCIADRFSTIWATREMYRKYVLLKRNKYHSNSFKNNYEQHIGTNSSNYFLNSQYFVSRPLPHILTDKSGNIPFLFS